MSELMKRSFEWLRQQMTIAKARHFRATFLPEGKPTRDAERVLAHLRIYCRAEGTTFHADSHEAARREGRREVWLEIQRYLQLDEEQVRKLVTVEDDYVD